MNFHQKKYSRQPFGWLRKQNGISCRDQKKLIALRCLGERRRALPPGLRQDQRIQDGVTAGANPLRQQVLI
ncbi:hypothetical protein CO662_09910 [Rhizobium anhuiense]|uniref:Uncharacterized protein n=1 Tax=Rhizobium anhuiense TaxID=1184720 RepID=A0A3S0QRS6_9HYPH|nr:hypothetical protein CO668_13730 [Rhizobium anhuiense]PDS52275.1 hypothetical protein CO662_09910 [Rhizobium anhuiense]PDS65100.1 hypothetical protein CO653_12945 [Rhizobium anhuiense]RUM01668.1 hypothetical protein EEQ99_15070 [Rhizobium anhuiense]